MSKAQKAVAAFKGGYNCSQAIFSVYAQDFGIDRDSALRLAGAFGGGIGCTADVCGAVTAACMVIGLRHGNHKSGAQPKAYDLVREFLERFRAQNGSTECRDLLGCDISTGDGMELAKDKKLFTTLCSKFVKDAAELVEEMV